VPASGVADGQQRKEADHVGGRHGLEQAQHLTKKRGRGHFHPNPPPVKKNVREEKGREEKAKKSEEKGTAKKRGRGHFSGDFTALPSG
jgi:hypothetical protein